MSLIEVKNLNKTFKKAIRGKGVKDMLKTLFSHKYENIEAVKDVSFNIEQGEIVGYIGANGAGKSTTVKMMCGILCPTSGEVYVNGLDVYKNRKKVNKELGVVFGQKTQLWWDIPLIETFEILKSIYDISDEDYNERFEYLKKLLDLDEFLNQNVRSLSLGQRMRADFAASLIHNPKILFLDEPTIGLDPTTKRTLWDLIRELNDEGNTIILCSHDMHEVDMLCDNVGIINTGNLVAYDTPQGLKDSLLKEEKEEHEIKMKNTLRDISNENEVNKSTKEDIETLNLKKMSFLLKENNDSIISAIQSNPKVHGVEMAKNGRFNLRIDNFDDDAVNDVLKDIIEAGGVVKSIFTQEPSLEDVFIKATAEVNEDDRA